MGRARGGNGGAILRVLWEPKVKVATGTGTDRSDGWKLEIPSGESAKPEF